MALEAQKAREIGIIYIVYSNALTSPTVGKMCIRDRLMALFAMSLFIPQAHAQWVVTDPGNFAGNIANSIKEIATASKTVKNTLSGFKEVEKLYNDTKKYYDALKQVNNLIGDAYKVKECILMVGDISEIYVCLLYTSRCV